MTGQISHTTSERVFLNVPSAQGRHSSWAGSTAVGSLLFDDGTDCFFSLLMFTLCLFSFLFSDFSLERSSTVVGWGSKTLPPTLSIASTADLEAPLTSNVSAALTSPFPKILTPSLFPLIRRK